MLGRHWVVGGRSSSGEAGFLSQHQRRTMPGQHRIKSSKAETKKRQRQRQPSESIKTEFPDGTAIASNVCRAWKDLLCPMFQAQVDSFIIELNSWTFNWCLDNCRIDIGRDSTYLVLRENTSQHDSSGDPVKMETLIWEQITPHNVIHGSAALASLGNLELQNMRLHPRPTQPDSAF